MIHKKLGKKQNNNNLGKLGRLKTETTDIQPSGRTSCLTSEQSYTNKHKQIKPIHDPLEIWNPGIIHQWQNNHNDQTKNHTHKLFGFQIFPRTSHKNDSDYTDRQKKNYQSEIIKS